MKYKIVKVTEKDGTESYEIRKKNFWGRWKPETYVHFADEGPLVFAMHRLTLDGALQWVESMKKYKRSEETIKEFEV
jgi:hypothetical protein